MEGDITRLKVPFRNTHTGPVAIEIVSACQCLEVDWPRDTLLTGESRAIDLTFFSANQVGDHVKTVDVILKNEDGRGYPVIKQFFVHVNVRLTAVDEAGEMGKGEKPVKNSGNKKGAKGKKRAKPLLKTNDGN